MTDPDHAGADSAAAPRAMEEVGTRYPMPDDMPEATRLVATGRGFMSSILGDLDMRVRLLSGGIARDRVIVATWGESVVGYLTFKCDGRGPYSPSLRDFCAAYGTWPGRCKWLLFSLLERRNHSNDLYVCGLKVLYRARRRGIARLLMKEAEHQASLLHKKHIALEVFHRNVRARQLYSSLGFSVRKEFGVPRFLRLFSFRRVILMRKRVGQPNPSTSPSVPSE